MSRRSLLAHRDFRLLLIGQTTSQFGAQISGIAIPLLAVLTLHASPLELGIITASSTLAFALIGLPAGVWLDRWRRRGILIVSDIARAVLLATIPLAALTGVLTITQLVVVSLLTGFARVFFDVGYQSYVPSVIGKERVLSGNSAMETVRASGQVVGPGIGGAFVSLIGAASVVAVQSLTFAVSALCLVAIREREMPVAPPIVRVPMWTQILEGLSFVWRTPILRATAAASALSNIAFAVASAVTFIFMSRNLELSPTAIGLIIAAGAVMAMAGAALTPALSRRVGSARIIWLALAMSGPLVLLGPLAQPGGLVTLLVVSMAGGEFGQIIYAITNVSLRQRLCPDRMLSRVTATMRFLIMGAFPLGALVGGAIGELAGVRAALWLSGALLVVAALPVYITLRSLRDVETLPAWRTASGE